MRLDSICRDGPAVEPLPRDPWTVMVRNAIRGVRIGQIDQWPVVGLLAKGDKQQCTRREVKIIDIRRES